jgi:diamine N-acetyltransferase
MLLQGQLVELRPIEKEDLPNYVVWFNDPDVVTYFGMHEPMSLMQEQRWYETQHENRDSRNYAVYYEGQHVGGAGYAHLDHRERSDEVGLLIGRKDLWDRGLGGDVLRCLLRHGFEQLNLHRISLRVYAENQRAVHCYEKVGFQHEGRQRQASFRHGRYHDLLLMSVLEDEYRAAQQGAPSVSA